MIAPHLRPVLKKSPHREVGGAHFCHLDIPDIKLNWKLESM